MSRLSIDSAGKHMACTPSFMLCSGTVTIANELGGLLNGSPCSRKMRYALKLKFVVALLLIFSTPKPLMAVPSQGGSDGGGGNLCYVSGAPILLELEDRLPLRLTPGLRYPQDDEPSRPQYGERLEPVSEQLYLGYHRMNLYSGRLGSRIREILAQNQSASPWLVRFFKADLVNFVASSFSTNREFHADFSDSLRCGPMNTRASAIFSNSLTAFVDLARWNQMDLDSQAGLYFHESLRFAQAYMRQCGTDFDLDDKSLQQIVQSMFLPHPPSLDLHPAINALWNELPGAYIFGSFHEMRQTPLGKVDEFYVDRAQRRMKEHQSDIGIHQIDIDLVLILLSFLPSPRRELIAALNRSLIASEDFTNDIPKELRQPLREQLLGIRSYYSTHSWRDIARGTFDHPEQLKGIKMLQKFHMYNVSQNSLVGQEEIQTISRLSTTRERSFAQNQELKKALRYACSIRATVRDFMMTGDPTILNSVPLKDSQNIYTHAGCD